MANTQKKWNENMNMSMSKNSSMFNQATNKKAGQDVYELKNVRNNSMMLNKTSSFITVDRPTTP